MLVLEQNVLYARSSSNISTDAAIIRNKLATPAASHFASRATAMHTLAACMSVANKGSEHSVEDIVEKNYSCTDTVMKHIFEQSLLKAVYTHWLPDQTVSIRLDITTAGKATLL